MPVNDDVREDETTARGAQEPRAREEKAGYHHLKTWPEHFALVWNGRKPFEVRVNDRDYRVGDVLCCHEWVPEDRHESDLYGVARRTAEGYTGRSAWGEVLHVASDLGVERGCVVMGVRWYYFEQASPGRPPERIG